MFTGWITFALILPSVLDVLQTVAGMEGEALLKGLLAEADRKFNFPSEWCSDSEDETMRAPISLTLADGRHAFSVQPFDSPTLQHYKQGTLSPQHRCVCS